MANNRFCLFCELIARAGEVMAQQLSDLQLQRWHASLQRSLLFCCLLQIHLKFCCCTIGCGNHDIPFLSCVLKTNVTFILYYGLLLFSFAIPQNVTLSCTAKFYQFLFQTWKTIVNSCSFLLHRGCWVL
jgi:hypothetical protein